MRFAATAFEQAQPVKAAPLRLSEFVMLAYLLKRLGISLIVLIGLSVVVFSLVRLVPGDTVTAMLGVNYSEADAAALRQRYGLDRPLVMQYAMWIGRVASGDLGTSISGRPVGAEIAEALPVTLELLAISLAMALVLGIPLGVAAGVRRNRLADYAAGLAGLIGLSVPGFWLGTLMILLFSLKLGWLPSGTYVSPAENLMGNLRHLLMPGVALGAAVTAVVMRMTRTSMIEVIAQDYVRTAKAKGVGRTGVVYRHALSNAMIPVMTIIGIQAGYLLAGSVVIEEVFSLSGVGRLMLRALGDRDYMLLQAAVLMVGSLFILINLAVDVLYTLIDPRVRTAE